MATADDDRLTADELLASPRGRSLIFDLAGRAPEVIQRELDLGAEPLSAAASAHQAFAETIVDAAYGLDLEQGAGMAVYLGAADSLDSQMGSAGPAEVAQKLKFITPAAPTQTDLEEAMRTVVAGATYWQPPHGEDLLAADPRVRAALEPFAEEVVASRLLDTSSDPLDTSSQWALAWDDSEFRDAPPAVFTIALGPEADYSEVTIDDLSGVDEAPGVAMPEGLDEWLAYALTSETAYRAAFAKDAWEETSGSWWSTPPFGLWSSTAVWPHGAPIGLDLIEDDMGLERARACRLRIRPNARICEINRPQDWAELCRRYPLDVTAQHRHDWCETTGRRGRWVIPDWSQVAEEFDGVHVSLAGYLRTAGVVIDVGEGSLVEDSPSLPTIGNTDEMTASLMAGWSPDTTYWLGDVITGIAEVVEWFSDEDTDEWVRR